PCPLRRPRRAARATDLPPAFLHVAPVAVPILSYSCSMVHKSPACWLSLTASRSVPFLRGEGLVRGLAQALAQDPSFARWPLVRPCRSRERKRERQRARGRPRRAPRAEPGAPAAPSVRRLVQSAAAIASTGGTEVSRTRLPSMSRCGSSASSQRGSHQLASPSSSIAEGTSTSRTI